MIYYSKWNVTSIVDMVQTTEQMAATQNSQTGDVGEDGSRIYIIFQRAAVRDVTECYNKHNIGDGSVHKSDDFRWEMNHWE